MFWTCNSVSGGKTSAFMYLKYPTEVSLFAVVKSDHPVNKVQDPAIAAELEKRCPGATGSMELESTLKAVLELEQLGGRAITWVASPYTFEQLSLGQTNIPRYRSRSPRLPDRKSRFCTEWLKIYPIWEFCYMRGGTPIMQIGFRADEPQRVEKDDRCDKLNMIKASLYCDIRRKRWRWTDQYWREVTFPLYSAGITRLDVLKYIEKTGIEFPAVSNCAYCPFHRVEEHQLQYKEHPEQMQPWVDLENAVSAHYGRRVTFHPKYSVKDAAMGLSQDMWGPLFSCACTD